LSCVFVSKVAGVVALVQLARGLTGKAVDHASAPDSRSLVDHVGLALHVLVLAFYRDFRRGGRDKTPPPPAPWPYLVFPLWTTSHFLT